jgi:hypothetical protein
MIRGNNSEPPFSPFSRSSTDRIGRPAGVEKPKTGGAGLRSAGFAIGSTLRFGDQNLRAGLQGI